MASEINAIFLTAPDAATPPVICNVCRNHVDMPNHHGFHARGYTASSNPTGEEHPSIVDTHEDAGNFDCSICLDFCDKPVVTHCGHLFCWPCLYYWLSLHSVSQECPVCKASVQGRIVPLYGRGRVDHCKNSAAMMFRDIEIPCRPQPGRSHVPLFAAAMTNQDGEHNDGIQDSELHNLSAGHAAASANEGSFQSMRRRSMASLTDYRGRAGNRVWILAPRHSWTNEKQIVLHWAFIVAASIAIVGLIVC